MQSWSCAFIRYTPLRFRRNSPPSYTRTRSPISLLLPAVILHTTYGGSEKRHSLSLRGSGHKGLWIDPAPVWGSDHGIHARRRFRIERTEDANGGGLQEERAADAYAIMVIIISRKWVFRGGFLSDPSALVAERTRRPRKEQFNTVRGLEASQTTHWSPPEREGRSTAVVSSQTPYIKTKDQNGVALHGSEEAAASHLQSGVHPSPITSTLPSSSGQCKTLLSVGWGERVP